MSPLCGRLYLLAHGRSGDKGDVVNIGVIARREDWYDVLVERVTAEVVGEFLAPLGIGKVERFLLPNLGALNFLVQDALGGGGSFTLQLDAQGKTYAAALLRMPLELAPPLAGEVLAHWGGAIPPFCRVEETP